MKTTPPSIRHVSPGRTISRFTNVPPAPQRSTARGGVSKTTTSPRSGSRHRYTSRFASTRSEYPASQPLPGVAQCSVGSIDEDGIRYGLTTYALTASTIATAPTIVTTQSIVTRHRCGSP